MGVQPHYPPRVLQLTEHAFWVANSERLTLETESPQRSSAGISCKSPGKRNFTVRVKRRDDLIHHCHLSRESAEDEFLDSPVIPEASEDSGFLPLLQCHSPLLETLAEIVLSNSRKLPFLFELHGLRCMLRACENKGTSTFSSRLLA